MTTHIIKEPTFYDTKYKFYNLRSNNIQDNIWKELQNGMWRSFDIDAYLNNEKQYAENVEHKDQIHNQLMFPHYAIIAPGHIWNTQKYDTEIEYTKIPLIEDCDRSSLISTIERYFSKFQGKKIGVHLSGGLDSSLIMAWLHKLKIPFTAIGFKSDRWEFRTERRIQSLMAEWAEYAELIDVEEYPFYSRLDGIPKTQTPYSIPIKNGALSHQLALRFKRQNVDVVFTGQGGDTLFVNPIQRNSDLQLPIGDEFELADENDLFYKPLGMQLISPYACMNIISQISSLRIGQSQDVPKWWARYYFNDILPKELSNYSFAADMFGLSQSGLEEAKPTTKQLFEEAYELTGNHNFSPVETKHFLERNVFELEFTTYIGYTSRIAVAAWLYALFHDENSSKA